VQGYTLGRQGAACRLSFSTELFDIPIDWQDTRRLTTGTVVALSTAKDKFKSICRVAVVAGRARRDTSQPSQYIRLDANNTPDLDVIWADAKDASIDPLEELVMIEATAGYYEAVRFAMLGLQRAARASRYVQNRSKQLPP
jgi:helicase required for RNAi-mediated heterochromatin assembly 1